MEKRPVGVLIRYSDSMIDNDVDTIEEHNKVIKKKGVVYVGKAGKNIGVDKLKMLSNPEIDSWLILVKREKGAYIFNKAKIVTAQRKKPNIEFIPAYYRNYENISTWFRIENPFQKMENKESMVWIIKSSGFPMVKTLPKSMAGYFMVARLNVIIR